MFMSLFENQLFSYQHSLIPHVTHWHRYVDDILCLWERLLPLANEFLELLNSFFPSIDFTMEVGEASINFLELTIRNTGEGYAFSIYRNNSATDSYVNDSSFCPWPHKLAAFNWLIYRLVSILMGRSDFEHEVKRILRQTIAVLP